MFNRLVTRLRRIEDALLVLILALMILLAGSQIVLRNLFDSGIFWSDPLVRALVLWIALVGAMVGARDNNHIRIDVLSRFLPERVRRFSGAVNASFTSVVCGFLALHSLRLVVMDWQAGSMAFAMVPVWFIESIMPLGFGIIALRYLLLAVLLLRSPKETVQ